MIKVNRTANSPESLKKRSGSCYREKDVVLQLEKDFNDKCYICEQKDLQSIDVEHLIPHKGNVDLKYDWNNLFYCCSHCNSVKNQEIYEGKILDCCKVDPEGLLAHSIENGVVIVKPLDEATTNETVLKTAQLITECFEKTNTGIRIVESKNMKRSLNETMHVFYRTLTDYKHSKSKDDFEQLETMLSLTYKFAGFTRYYVRSHLADYPELEKCLN
ncbi:MAG: HNH endonuclease [Oscillospiraceae bacterium]|nr:HNH endonuclease [Oscillospiraceae bacterium]